MKLCVKIHTRKGFHSTVYGHNCNNFLLRLPVRNIFFSETEPKIVSSTQLLNICREEPAAAGHQGRAQQEDEHSQPAGLLEGQA